MATASPVPHEQFYVVGGNLHPDAPSYVRRQADDDLYDALGRGEFCYILTSRQMGKSSLIVRTATRLVQDGVKVVTLDLTGIGQNLTADQWYSSLLLNIGERLDLEDELDDFWDEHDQVSSVRRFTGALHRVVLPAVEGRLVLFLDEIDVAQSLPFSANEFFAAIRHCYTRRSEDPEFERLSFCLAGVATPSDLIDDPLTTPFNIGTRIELTDFAEDEAVRLAEGLGREDAVAAMLVRRVLHWTNGHPYLTQRVCQAVQGDDGVRTSADVDRLCEELFFSDRARDQDPNLQFVRNQMLWRDLDHAALLGMYGDVLRGKNVTNDETNPLVNVLRLAGIARVDGGKLVAKNRIYGRVFDKAWIRESMPDAEVRRQRAAYWRGVARTAVTAGVIGVAMLGLVVLAVTQARRADQATDDALVLAATRQMEAGTQLLASGDAAGLLDLVAVHDMPLLSPQVKASARRLWAAWYASYEGQLLSLRVAHSATRTAVTRDLTLAAELGRDGTVRIRNMTTGAFIGGPLVHSSGVGHLVFSPDGSLIMASSPGTTHVWRVDTGELVMPRVPSGFVVAFSHDSTKIAICEGTLSVWDLVAARPVADAIPMPFGFSIPKFSPDGLLIATASADATVRLWDAQTLEQLKPSIPQDIATHAVEFSPNSKLLLTGATDGRIRMWDVASRGQVGRTLTRADGVHRVTWNGDGSLIATATLDRATVWDASESRPIGTPVTHGSFIEELRFAADGNSIVTCSATSVRVWSLPADGAYTLVPRHVGLGSGADISPDGSLLATGGYDSTVHVLNLESRELLYPPLSCPSGVNQVAFSPDSRLLAAGDGSGAVTLWNAATGSVLDKTFTHDGGVWGVEFSPDGQFLASGGEDNVARLWSVQSATEVVPPMRHTGRVLCVAFNGDGSLVATASQDASVCVWNTETGERVGAPMLQPIAATAVAFSPDGTRLAISTYDGHIRFWDVALRTQVGAHIRHLLAWNIEYSVDGKLLASGSLMENDAQLWDVETGLRYGSPFRHARSVIDVAFSADMAWLATTSDDGIARLWPIPNPVDANADLAALSQRDLGLYHDARGTVQTVLEQNWQALHAGKPPQ